MKVLTSKIVNGKKMFLIEDNDSQGRVFAQDGKPIKKENISYYNPYYVDVKGINSSDNVSTKLTPSKKITPQELKQIKESSTNVGNIALKEKQEKVQRLKEAEEAYQKIKSGAPVTPELLAQETQAIGDKISLQNIPGVGQYIPDILDVTGGIGSMASNLGALPLNLNRGNYGQALLSVAAPLATGALAGASSPTMGQFINNIINPLAGIKLKADLPEGTVINGISLSSFKKPSLKFKSEIDWSKWNKEIPDNKSLMAEYHAIEQRTKANNTWMKNSDGSEFEGTPEQFIQQNSENFKNAFGKSKIKDNKGNPLVLYHGTPMEFSAFVPPKFTGNSTSGYKGEYSFFTPDKKLAEHYSGNLEGISFYGQTEKNINKIKSNSNLKSVYINSENPLIDSRTEFVERDIPKSLREGKDAILGSLNPDEYSEVAIPYGNNVKSAIGNNGMFNMKSRNIYKTVVGGLASGVLGKEAMKKKEFGGNIKILDTKIENNKKYYLINE